MYGLHLTLNHHIGAIILFFFVRSAILVTISGICMFDFCYFGFESNL